MLEDKYTNGGMNDQDQQIVLDLERMLDTRNEDAQSLLRIRERLLKLSEGSLPVSEFDLTAIVPMKSVKVRSLTTSRSKKRSIYPHFDERKGWLQPLSAIAAVLMVAIIVGSLALLLTYLRQGTTGNGSRVFSQRQGWTQFVIYSGKGNKTLTGLNLALPHLWGDALACVGSGKLDIELTGAGMTSFLGKSPCDAKLSSNVTPQSITFEVSTPTPKIQTMKVTADAGTTWYIEISQAIAQPTLTIGSEWVQSIGIGGNGSGSIGGNVLAPTQLNGKTFLPKTWAVAFVCIGTGNGHFEMTPTPVTGNGSIPPCDGQPRLFVMHYNGPTQVEKIVFLMHGDIIWNAKVLACADEQKC